MSVFKSISMKVDTIKNQLALKDEFDRFAGKAKFQGPLRMHTGKDGQVYLRPRTLKEKINEMRHKDQAQEAKKAVYDSLRKALCERFKVGNDGNTADGNMADRNTADSIMKRFYDEERGKFHNIRLDKKFMSDIQGLREDRNFYADPSLETPF